MWLNDFTPEAFVDSTLVHAQRDLIRVVLGAPHISSCPVFDSSFQPEGDLGQPALVRFTLPPEPWDYLQSEGYLGFLAVQAAWDVEITAEVNQVDITRMGGTSVEIFNAGYIVTIANRRGW